MAVVEFAERTVEGAEVTGGDDAMGAGDALGSPVLEKMTVELSGIEDNAVWLATGFPVLEKRTVELRGFKGDAVWLTTGGPVLENMTVELSGFKGGTIWLATGFPVLEKTTVELSGLEGNGVCVEAGAEGGTAENGVTGPEATNTAVLLLAGETTATAENAKLVAGAAAAEVVFDGRVTSTAGGAATAGGATTAGTTGAKDAVLAIEATETERAVFELGGSACEGSALGVERAEAVAGPTVPTIPSIIEIVVAGLLTTKYGGVSTVIVMVVKALLTTSKYCGIGVASAVPSKYWSKYQATYMTRYMTAVPLQSRR